VERQQPPPNEENTMSDHHTTQAEALSYIAMVMFAIAILFPLFIWLAVATHG